jgi:dUTPase
MKLIKREYIGIRPVFNTNVEEVHNYVGNSVINHNCIVDEDYQGEVHINMQNTGNYPVRILEDEKLIQFLLQPVLYNTPTEVPYEELYANESERGAGGFGHTDKK